MTNNAQILCCWHAVNGHWNYVHSGGQLLLSILQLVQILCAFTCFKKKKINSITRLVIVFLQSSYKAEHRSGLEKSLNPTPVGLSWHSAFVAAGQGERLWAPSFCSDGNSCSFEATEGKKKPWSQWGVNRISINYASSGLHKTFQEAGETRLCLAVCWIK